MTGARPEFSRLVPLARLGQEGFHRRIEAVPDELERLSRRFGLIALDRLTAMVELRRQSAETILMEAAFEAEFVQSCVVTLEPVRGAIADRFTLVYGPADEAEGEVELAADAAAFEPLSGDAIDIGEAVAQELSLSLPLFPRGPEEMVDAATDEEPVRTPFAALARLRKPDPG